MSIEKAILKVFASGGEEYIHGKNEKHANSMRVIAFNIRRRMPKDIQEGVGIQRFSEHDNHFIRIYNKKMDEAEVWVRDEVTGRLVPKESVDEDKERIVKLMRQDGKTEEEIEDALKSM